MPTSRCATAPWENVPQVANLRYSLFPEQSASGVIRALVRFLLTRAVRCIRGARRGAQSDDSGAHRSTGRRANRLTIQPSALVRRFKRRILLRTRWGNLTGRTVFDAALILAGCVCMALSVDIFLNPNNVVPGGFTGARDVCQPVVELAGGRDPLRDEPAVPRHRDARARRAVWPEDPLRRGRFVAGDRSAAPLPARGAGRTAALHAVRWAAVRPGDGAGVPGQRHNRRHGDSRPGCSSISAASACPARCWRWTWWCWPSRRSSSGWRRRCTR